MHLRTKSGELTAYAFACGHIERIGNFTLSKGFGVYFIRGRADDGTHVHRADKTLSMARKTLREVARIYAK